MTMIPRLRLEHLYLVTALALGGFVVALLPIVPHDFWWHMAIGRDMARGGALPTVDVYSWSVAPGTPFTYQSWLSELIFFWVNTAGGIRAIIWLRNILFVLTLLVLAIGAWQRSGSWRLAALAVMGTTALVVNNMTVRPQIFSWLPFAIFLTVLTSYRKGALPGRALLVLPLTMVLWVNFHGAFILGIILLTLTAIGETLTFVMRGRSSASPGSVRWLWLMVAITILATVANPTGLGVFAYVQDLLTDVPSQRLVVEWQPLRLASTLGIVLAGAAFITAGLWLRARSEVDLTDLVIWAGFLWIAISGARYVIWWAMITWPIMAGLIADQGLWRKRGRQRSSSARGSYLNTGLALCILLVPLSVQPPFKARWSLPPAFGGLGPHVPDGTLIAAGTPVKATSWLHDHPLPADARVFHDMGFGSYLIWAIPELRVYVDPRVELYPLEEWLRYKRITAGCNYNRELRDLDVTHLMLSHAEQADLVAALRQDNAWNTLYDDDETIIYERTAAGGNVAACIQPQP